MCFPQTGAPPLFVFAFAALHKNVAPFGGVKRPAFWPCHPWFIKNFSILQILPADKHFE